MLLEKIKTLAQGRKITVITHRKPDVDALSSAYVMAKHLGGAIAFEEEPDSSAKVLIEKLNISYKSLREASPPYVVVDSSSKILVRLGSYEDVLAIIDHHQESKDTFHAPIEVRDPTAQSTAEIIARELTLELLDKDDAFALAAGIYTDTNLFYAANDRSINLFNSLLQKSGRDFQEVVDVGYPERPLDEEKALAEGMKRLEDYIIPKNGRDYFIVFTQVGTKTGTLANILSKIFDVVFVLNWEESERATKVSTRASKYVDINLAKLMDEVREELNGGGGGHMKAAGGQYRATPEEVKKVLLEKIKERLP